MSQSITPGRGHLRGRYWTEDLTITAGAADHHLGAKGLFVASEIEIATGALLQFELTVGEERPITGKARVVEAAAEAGRPGLRVKFVQIDDVDAARALLARVDLPEEPPPSAGELGPPAADEASPPSSSAPTSSKGGKKRRKRKKGSSSSPSVAAVTAPSSVPSKDRVEPVPAEEATSRRWESAMALEDEFFDRPPPSSRGFEDEPTADSMLVRAADPVFRARQQKLQRTFAVVVAAAALLLVGAVALRGAEPAHSAAPSSPRASSPEATTAPAASSAPAPSATTPPAAEAGSAPEVEAPSAEPAPSASTAPTATAAPSASASAAPAAAPTYAPETPRAPKAPPPRKAPPPKTKPPASKPAAADIYE